MPKKDTAMEEEKTMGTVAEEEAILARENAEMRGEDAPLQDITDVLGANVELWFKRRIQMPDLVGKWLKFTNMEYRARDEGGYYILHFENKDGQQATSTTSSPKIKAKAAALINRGIWPVTGTIVPEGKGYDIVKAVK